MRKDNRGISLTELILAMALAGFVALGITSMMMNSSKNYTMTSAEVDLLKDAQVIMNSISTRVLEANNVTYASGTGLLTLYHTGGGGTYDPKDVFWLNSTDHELYYFHLTDTTQETEMLTWIADPHNVAWSETLENHFLSDAVSGITCSADTPAGLTGTSLVTITLKLKNTFQSYELTNHIKLRNQVVPIP